MKVKGKRICVALGATLIYIISVILVFDCFYYVNDDFIIRDILSGRYSGVPDAHVYNVIYPFAKVVMYLYKLCPRVDFWAICMIGSIFTCLFLVLMRILQMVHRRIIAIIWVYVLFSCVALYAICYFTFTATGTICSLTALFLFVTSETYELKTDKLLLGALLLLLISFCVRKDTFLMVLPFFGVWSFYLLFSSSVICKKMFQKIGVLFTLLFTCCGVLWGLHTLAFSDSEWQDFLVFRELRKSVHDFAGYPVYDSAEEFYQELGLAYEEYAAVGTTGAGGVNTVLDYSIEIRDILNAVIEYNEDSKDSHTWKRGIKRAISYIVPYILEVPGMESRVEKVYVWNFILGVVCSFGGIFIACYRKDRILLVALLGGMMVVGTEMLFLGYIGRMTVMVRQLLMTLFFCWPLFVLVTLWKRLDHYCVSNRVSIVLSVCMFGICLFSAGHWFVKTVNAQKTYKENSVATQQLIEYCTTHPGNAYFQPACSIAKHSFRLGENYNCDFNNLVILGGWNATSPEYNQSLETLGIEEDTIEQSILTKENVYIISPEKNIENIIQYFEWKYKDQLEYKIIDSLPIFDGTYVYDLKLIKD